MSIKEKMNVADNVNKNEDETSDEEEVQQNQDQLQVPGDTKSRITSASSLPSIVNKNGGNVPLTLENVEALGLPEDQEIQEQEEEEEA